HDALPISGYGFVIYRSRGKDWVFNILMVSMMIPFAAIMVPLYRLFGSMSDFAPMFGIDTLGAAILPTVTTMFFIFLFRQNTKMFPRDLIEAGGNDGLSEFCVFLRVFIVVMEKALGGCGCR